MLLRPKLPAVRLPRPPLVPDPLRRVAIPRDLEPLTTRSPAERPAAEGGMTPEGVERIWSATERLFRHGVHPAITLTIRREGVVVLDRSIGWARGVGPEEPADAEPVLATPETPFCLFSASKAVTATVIHLLDERGLLHVGDRVGEYVPEFVGPGKHRITIDHVLSHRAGIPNIPGSVIDMDRIQDHDFVMEHLNEALVRTRPGSRLSYHAISGGFVLAAVVRAVTGKELKDVLREEILEPLGFRWMGYGVAEEDLPLVGTAHATGLPPVPPLSTALTRAFGMSLDAVTHVSNDPRFLTAEIPSANVVSTADELSRFLELLRGGGELDGTRILEPRTIRRAIIERSHHEMDLTLGAPLRHASGYMLGAKALGLYGPDTESAFGHLGFTNVLGWADPRRATSVGLVTTGKPALAPHLPDLWNLTRRIGLEAPKVEHPVLFGD
ncbi:serine hydrolase [Patulibacter sp.]|uniref:serine hydrolase domain-containing protein n=1 Tax=Patulibacter sp. TaxID=1912859 RepID=UPI00271B8154|nr:serine hydrolase domain-containing protein [Patulibacter sp.]MDO9409173.1 serine hydrolase domain-containing protein [Patulibacter sp.]